MGGFVVTIAALAEPSLEHFEAWAERLILDTGEPWRLEPFQRRFVADLFAAEPETRCWLIVPEGNGKTTLVAGIALYHIEHTETGYVPIAASTREQAEILYRQAESLVFRSELKGTFKCQEGYRRIKCEATGARVQIYAADAGAADGVIPTLPLIDELHRHKNLALYRTWAGKLRKRQAKMVVISTAGEPGSDFEEIRAKVKQNATEIETDETFTRAVSGRILLHDWSVPENGDIEDLELVARANPLKAVTVEHLREKRSADDMSVPHWRRFTCNLAAMQATLEQFIDGGAWAALGGGEQIPDRAAVCLGADGSRTWDTTVVAWAALAKDDRIDVDAKVFSVREDVAHHVFHEGGRIDFDDVEQDVLDLFDRYRVAEAAYDPRYLDRSMEIVDRRLPDARIFAVEPNSVVMRAALQAFYRTVTEGKLRHQQDDVLAAHLANTKVERDERTREIRRIGKIDRRKPIDAVPAMALAVWRVTCGATDSVYAARGVIAV